MQGKKKKKKKGERKKKAKFDKVIKNHIKQRTVNNKHKHNKKRRNR